MGRRARALGVSGSAPAAAGGHQGLQGGIIAGLPPGCLSLKGSPGCRQLATHRCVQPLQRRAPHAQAPLEGWPPQQHGVVVGGRLLGGDPVLQLGAEGRGGQEIQAEAAALAGGGGRQEAKEGERHGTVVGSGSMADAGAGGPGSQGGGEVEAVEAGEDRVVSPGKGAAGGVALAPDVDEVGEEHGEGGLGGAIAVLGGVRGGGTVRVPAVEAGVRAEVVIPAPQELARGGAGAGGKRGEGGLDVFGAGGRVVRQVNTAQVEAVARPGEGNSSKAALRAPFHLQARHGCAADQLAAQQHRRAAPGAAAATQRLAKCNVHLPSQTCQLSDECTIVHAGEEVVFLEEDDAVAAALPAPGG